MYIVMPNEFNICMNDKERKTIEDCRTTLTQIQEEMEKYDCTDLETEDFEIITYGHLEDILAQLSVLLEVYKMH